MPKLLKFGNSESTWTPDASLRKLIDQGAEAEINRCWTCGSCDFECPVNIATGKLRPQKIVRMANFGMLDELLHSPAIWYCQSCRRCRQICPNTVKPSELISHIRRIVLERNLISTERYRSYRLLFERFQRVRKHAIGEAFHGELYSIAVRQWCDWLLAPIKESLSIICIESVRKNSINRLKNRDPAKAAACFTCGECSSACPIACERGVFDPRTLFRMFNIGLVDELLTDPAIWLCLDCGRCTDACSQLVDGRDIIRQLKDHAVHKGIVNHTFFMRQEQVNRLVYARWLEEVDALLGIDNKSTSSESHDFNEFSMRCRDWIVAASA